MCCCAYFSEGWKTFNPQCSHAVAFFHGSMRVPLIVTFICVQPCSESGMKLTVFIAMDGNSFKLLNLNSPVARSIVRNIVGNNLNSLISVLSSKSVCKLTIYSKKINNTILLETKHGFSSTKTIHY